MSVLGGSEAEQGGAAQTTSVEFAQAWLAEAVASGTVSSLGVDIAGGTATAMRVALCANSGGKPGAVLGEGVKASGVSTGANVVAISGAPAVVKGQTYFVAVLGTNGSLKVRGASVGATAYFKSAKKRTTIGEIGAEWTSEGNLGPGSVWILGEPTGEGPTYKDSPTGKATSAGALAERIAFVEARSGQGTAAGSAHDTLSFSDPRSGSSATVGSNHDALRFADACSGCSSTAGSNHDALRFADSPLGASVCGGAVHDSLTARDSPAGASQVTGSIQASHGFRDAASGTALATGAATDSIAYTDTPRGKATCTATQSERCSYRDVVSGVAATSGSLTEAWHIGPHVELVLTSDASAHLVICADGSAHTIVKSAAGAHLLHAEGGAAQ